MKNKSEKEELIKIAKILGVEDLAKYGFNLNRKKDRIKLLEDLNIRMLYQQFDLEATRRENSYLRKMLEEDNRKEI